MLSRLTNKIKTIYYLPFGQKCALAGHLAIVISILAVGHLALIYFCVGHVNGKYGLHKHSQATAKSATTIAQMKKLRTARATMVKNLRYEDASLNKTKLVIPADLDQTMSRYLYAICVNEKNSYCLDNPDKLTPAYMNKIKTTNSIDKAFTGFTASSKSTKMIKQLVQLNNLTYQQKILSDRLHANQQKGVFATTTFEVLNSREHYPKEYEWSLTKGATSYPSDIQMIKYVLVNLLFLLLALLFRLAGTMILWTAPFIGPRVSNSLNSISEIMSGRVSNKKQAAKNINKIDTGKINFKDGRQIVEDKNQWDAWEKKLATLTKNKQIKSKANNNKLVSAWNGLNNLSKEQKLIDQEITNNTQEVENLNSNLNLIFSAIKPLPLLDVSAKSGSLKITLNATVNDIEDDTVIADAKDAANKLVLKLSSLTTSNGWEFSLLKNDQVVISNNQSVSHAGLFIPILQKKLILIQQTAINRQAHFFTILNSIITPLNNNEEYSNNLIVVREELQQELLLKLDNLAKDKERNGLMQAQFKEKIATCVKNSELPMFDILGQDRASKWFKQLTDASLLQSIEKIETSFNNSNDLIIIISIKPQNIKAANGDIYHLEPMRLVGQYRVKTDCLRLHRLRCKSVHSDKIAPHPHVVSRSNSGACLGKASKPFASAAKQDDLFAMLHILANWSSTVSKTEMHQERLIKWCQRMPDDAPLGIIEKKDTLPEDIIV